MMNMMKQGTQPLSAKMRLKPLTKKKKRKVKFTVRLKMNVFIKKQVKPKNLLGMTNSMNPQGHHIFSK